jgi:hypothetical protein
MTCWKKKRRRCWKRRRRRRCRLNAQHTLIYNFPLSK